MKFDVVALNMEQDDFALYCYGARPALTVELPRFEALARSAERTPVQTPLVGRGSLDFILDLRRALAR